MTLQEVILPNTITSQPNHVQTDISNNTQVNCMKRNKAWIVDIEEDMEKKREFYEIPFYKILLPFFRLMAIVGLYRQTFSIAKTIYGGVVVTLLWINVVRSAVSLWIEEELPTEMLISRIISCVWLLQSACIASVCYQLCFTEKYQTFFQHFEQSCQSRFSQYIGLQIDLKWLRKVVVFAAATCVLLCVMNAVSSLVFIYIPFESAENTTWTTSLAPFDTSSHVLIQGVIHISFFFASAAWFFPISLFCIICLQLSKQFKQLNTVITKTTQKDGTITMCLEMIRREHQHLCRSVGHADDIFSFIVLVELGLNMPLICFLLYEVIVVSYPVGSFLFMMLVFWLIIICSTVGMISWFAALLHENAHAAVHNLHDISISPGTENHRILEVSMFMAKMNGTPIAITLWNLIPLTKEFILTVIGVLVTYFALVAQTI
ncbi:uncharacterized protein LOC144352779 [Saccoglossus kowalevskii]